VRFERVPLMYGNTSDISVPKNLVFHKKMRHVERRHHLLRDHVEKEDIEMRYIDIERQLADIFTKPLDSSRFTDLQGKIDVCHPHGLVWGGELVLYPIYYIFCFSLTFSSYSPKSPCFICYTSLYLLNYAYHCVRMSTNEI
jgi:hypothetical protein